MLFNTFVFEKCLILTRNYKGDNKVVRRLQNKIAIVTGGSSGIGKAIVDLFREEGATACVFDIKGEGNNYYNVDITKEDRIVEAVKEVISQYGKIDILVNNAGCAGANCPTHLMDIASWDRTFDVDVKGVMLCSKAVLPIMIENGGGSIINLSSIYGTHGTNGDLTAYHAAKGAVLALTKQDATTYGRKNVRVNAILPGAIVTPLLKEFGGQFPGGWEAYKQYVSKHTPLKRLGEPKDIAYGALFLASDESKFVTGIGLYIDGGYTIW